jgi:hypothetical protein
MPVDVFCDEARRLQDEIADAIDLHEVALSPRGVLKAKQRIARYERALRDHLLATEPA